MIAAYAACGNVREACEIAGVDRSTHYEWLSDDDYAAAFARAVEDAADRMEQAAWHQAIAGVRKLVLYKGEPVRDPAYPNADPPVYLYEYTYSSAVLIAMLRAARPDKYRDNLRVENAGDSRLHVAFDPDWYGNDAHDHATEAAPAPATDPEG